MEAVPPQFGQVMVGQGVSAEPQVPGRKSEGKTGRVARVPVKILLGHGGAHRQRMGRPPDRKAKQQQQRRHGGSRQAGARDGGQRTPLFQPQCPGNSGGGQYRQRDP